MSEPQLQIKAGDFVDLVQRGFYTGCRACARKLQDKMGLVLQAQWRRFSRFGRYHEEHLNIIENA